MAQPNQSNILVSLINAHTDTIDAHKKLMAYMQKHLNELEQLYLGTKKDFDAVTATVTKLTQENAALSAANTELKNRVRDDNVALDEIVDDVEEIADNIESAMEGQLESL